MENEKQLQQKYVQMQVLDHQIKHAQKQIQLIEQQSMELIVAMQALEEIKTAKPGSELLIPLASGIFAKAELKDNSGLILNIGANTAVVKDIPSTMKIIDKQMKEMKSVQEQLFAELQHMVAEARHLESEIGKLSQ